ncbi:hypothetical protein Tco_1144082 [Tanacetum coccineum]
MHKKRKNAPAKKKSVVPRKKHSLTVEYNILPDPEEAFELGKAISLTKAEHEEEERRLHETHASLVIHKKQDFEEDTNEEEVQPLIRRSTGVVIGREIPKQSSEEALDHSKKNKADQEKVDDGMKDAKNDESEKAEEEHTDEEEKADDEQAGTNQAGDEEPVDDQVRSEQARNAQANVVIPESAVPNPSSNTTEPEIQSMVDVPIYQEDPVVQQTPLIDIIVLMIPEKTIPTPTQTTLLGKYCKQT